MAVTSGGGRGTPVHGLLLKKKVTGAFTRDSLMLHRRDNSSMQRKGTAHNSLDVSLEMAVRSINEETNGIENNRV